jgi:hypothetical protein
MDVLGKSGLPAVLRLDCCHGDHSLPRKWKWLRQARGGERTLAQPQAPAVPVCTTRFIASVLQYLVDYVMGNVQYRMSTTKVALQLQLCSFWSRLPNRTPAVPPEKLVFALSKC